MPLIDRVQRLTKDQRDHLQAAAPAELKGIPLLRWPEESVVHLLCDALQLPTYPLTADNVDEAAYEAMEEACARHSFLPLFQSGVLLCIACLEPWNAVYLGALRRALRKEVRPIGITEREFEEATATLGARIARRRANRPAAVTPALRAPLFAWPFDPDDRNGPLVTAAYIIDLAHQEGASDIHLEPYEDELSVRFRINNDIHPMPPIEGEYRDVILDAFKIKANIPITELGVILRGRMSEVTSIGPLDLRVECLPTQHGHKIVSRLLDPRSLTRFYGKLPFQGTHKEILRRCIDSAKGLILVTGPTGSGKSTTLLGIITSLDIHGLNISTIEDPIEYTLKYINQTDVSRAVPGHGRVGFASALKSLLRQDPDVIMVGEIRDLDTMNQAIIGSQTGHLIFSTLHTNNCVETVKRALDMREDRDRLDATSLASSLSCVVAQRLVEKLCPDCSEAVPTPTSARRWFEAYGMPVPDQVRTRCGCNKCRHGIVGRLPVFEVMEITEELRALITADFSEKEFERVWRAQGGVTLAEYGLGLVAQGLVDYREVRSLIWSAEALAGGG